MTANDLVAIAPEIIVALTACVVIVVDAAVSRSAGRAVAPAIAVVGLLAALIVPTYTTIYPTSAPAVAQGVGPFFGGYVLVDQFTSFFRALFIVLAVFAIVVAPEYLERKKIPSGEYYATVLFSTLGAMTIALSSDLITLFVGLELMTIPIYVLAGMQRTDRYSNEAALKYFLLGAFSSALLLYGFVWLYGITRATDFAAITAYLVANGVVSGPTIIALALVTVGLGFKAAVVPFHQWTPDAYDGAPTPATAFMSVGPKAAAFAAIL